MPSWKKPTAQQVDRAIALMKKAEQYRYFFLRLENPTWLQPLRDKGFFQSPPSGIEEGEYVRFPIWPESSYLARIAATDPNGVFEVIRHIPPTVNFRVHQDLVQAAINMPAQKAAEMVPMVVGWLEDPFLGLLPEYVSDLMCYLAEKGEADGALQLLEALTEPAVEERSMGLVEGLPPRVWREARPRYHPWFVRQLIEGRLPKLSKLDPLAVAEVLEIQLRKCIDIEGRTPSGLDRSDIWRPAIEDHPQNWGQEDLKNTLIVGLRNALERAVGDSPERTRSVVKSYLSDPLSILRRLALHLIGLDAEHCRELLAEVIQDNKFRNDTTLHHERYRLVQEHFHLLPGEAQRKYLSIVEHGPDLGVCRKRAEQVTGLVPSVEETERYKRQWQLQQLNPICNALPPEWRAKFETLLAEFGEPEHPDFLAWHSVGWVGPTSPRDRGELAEMSPADVLAYVKGFDPSDDPWGPSREGLARELESVVTEKPQEYISVAADFLHEGVHSTYVYHLAQGLHEAWKQGAELDWEPILDFCEPISLALTDNDVELAEAPLGIDDVGWSGVRMAIARFFSGALHRDDRALPMELMPRIREILLGFMRDPDPRPEDEEKHAAGGMDWVTVRINTTRGVTAFALLEYALRYARLARAGHRSVKEDKGHPSRFEREVKAAFSDMLDKSKEPSAAVHSIFGEGLSNFLYLDRDWAVDNLGRIFPSERDKKRYWEAAWEGYLLYRPRVYKELYELLRPQYWEAIGAMGQGKISRTTERTLGSLAQHLALTYRLGYEQLGPVPTGEREGSLLAAFLESASGELRAAIAHAVGSDLRPDRPIEVQDWERLRNYWEARIEAAQKAPGSGAFDQELSAFSSWLQGVPEELDSLAPLLRSTIRHLVTGYHAHEALDYLSKESQSHPALAVEMLREILERQATLDRRAPQDSIYLFGVDRQIWTILEDSLVSKQTGRREAIFVINMLGERGQHQYRELLGRASED